jgi:predicted MPP superfamily phosphohydrolase
VTTLRFALFFLALLTVVGGLNVFVHRRISSAFALSTDAKRGLAGALAAVLFAMVVGRLFGAGVSRVLGGVAAVAELGVLVSAGLLLLEALVLAVARLVLRRPAPASPAVVELAHAAADGANPVDASTTVSDRVVADQGQALEPTLSRRALFARASAGAIMVVGGGSATYGGLFGRHDYALEEVPIRLERLPRELDGFTIVQLSDIHLGAFVGDHEVARALELVRRARPQAIVLTGDLVDHDPAYAEDLGRLTRRLGELAPVLAVPGNHDHYAGVARVLDAVRGGGGTVLDNRSARMGEGRIHVAGVDDLWARRFRLGRGPDLDAALAEVNGDGPRILLAHQPVFFEESAARVDLQLSGHTHGGQFNLGVRPADFVLPNGWIAGRYVRGSAQLYVNRGFGTAGPPARLGAAPEVTRLVLTV